MNAASLACGTISSYLINIIAILEGEERDTGAKNEKNLKTRATIFQEIQLTPAR